jgi:sugar transferase (PEP-CTERM/EpsH1 system associated)
VRVLFLTHRLPYAPNRGDRIRAFHMLQALQKCAEVTVASLVHDDEEASQVERLGDLATDVIAARVPRRTNLLRGSVKLLTTRRPLTLELLHAPELKSLLQQGIARARPDVVLAYCSSMARFAMEPPLNRTPFVLDMVDVDSAKWRALSQHAAWPKRAIYAREAVCLAQFERDAIRAAAMTLVVNEREAAVVQELVPGAVVKVIQNGIDLASFKPPTGPAAVAEVTFCGVLDYEPNEAAALRLARDIWPRVRRHRPDATLLLLGSRPTPAIRALPGFDSSIRVTGAVPDVKPFLWNSALAAVPLVTARGVQNKVLEALAAGLPVVVSPIVAEGLPESALRGCIVAGHDEEFARSIVHLLDAGPAARRQQAERASLDRLTWSQQLQPLCGVLERASQSGSPTLLGREGRGYKKDPEGIQTQSLGRRCRESSVRLTF